MSTPFLPLPGPGDISDGVPFYYTASDSVKQNQALSTHQAALYGLGIGVIPTVSNALQVSAGSGLNYNLTAGYAVVRHSTMGPFFMVQSALAAQGPLAANRGVGNEIYLFLAAQRDVTNDTAFSGLGQLIAWDNNTYDGGILLATITTGASSISSVVPNVDRFAELKIHNYTEETTPDSTDEILLWDSATGTLMKATLANVLASNGGVVGPASATNNAIVLYDGTTGKLVKDSAKLLPTGAIVGTTDTQTLTNKTLTSPTINGGTISGITDLTVADGGTGASTAAAARTNLGAAASGAITGGDLTMATNRLLGRTTASTGAIEQISVDSSLSLAATILGIATGGIVTDMIATGGQISSEVLEYIAITDVASALAVTAATWVDIVPNQTFTIARADNRQVNVLPSGIINISTSDPTGGSFAVRLLFDSATTATPLPLGGAYVTAVKPENMLQGTGSPRITGLGAGSHTVKLQVKCEVAASVYLRAATKPDYENFRLRVVEGKR